MKLSCGFLVAGWKHLRTTTLAGVWVAAASALHQLLTILGHHMSESIFSSEVSVRTRSHGLVMCFLLEGGGKDPLQEETQRNRLI